MHCIYLYFKWQELLVISNTYIFDLPNKASGADGVKIAVSRKGRTN